MFSVFSEMEENWTESLFFKKMKSWGAISEAEKLIKQTPNSEK